MLCAWVTKDWMLRVSMAFASTFMPGPGCHRFTTTGPRGPAVPGRPPRVPGGLGQDAGERAAHAPRHTVRLPGHRARDDEHAVRRPRGLPRRRVAELPRPGHVAGARGRSGPEGSRRP